MADGSLGKLVVELSANVAKFQQDMQSAVGIAEKSMAGITSAANLAKTAIGALGIGLSAAGLAAFIRGTAEAVGALKTLSEQTGVSVEALSAMRTVAKYADTDLASVATGAQKLARAMLEAGNPTTTAAKAFAAIGVATRDVTGQLRSSEAVMQDIGRVMGEMSNATERVALAQVLFGKSGAQLVPFLLELGRAGELNAKVTTAQAEAAKEFDDNLKRLTTSAGKWKVELVGGLLPSLNALLEQLLRLKNLSLDQLFGRGEGLSGKQIAEPFSALTDIEGRIKRLQELRDNLAQPTFRNRLNDIFFGDVRDLDLQIRRLQQQRDVLKEIGQQQASKLAPLAEPPTERSFAGLADADKDKEKLSDLQKLVKSLQEEFIRADAAGSKLGEVMRELALPTFKLQPGENANVAVQLAKAIDKRKGEQDEIKRLLEGEKQAYAGAGDVFDELKGQRLAFLNQISGREELVKLQAQMSDLVRGMVDGDISTEQFDRARRALAGLNDEYEQYLNQLDRIRTLESSGVITSDRADEERVKALDKYNESLTKLVVNEKEANNWARELGLTFTSAFEDAIVSGKKLQDIVRALIQDIAKIAIRKTVTEPGGKLVDQGIAALAQLAQAYIGGQTGNYSASQIGASGAGQGDLAGGTFDQYIGRRAGGGPVSKGSPYLVGEEGPELFVPNASGSIVPNGQGGNTTYIDARGADQAAISRLETLIMALAGPGRVERRSVSAFAAMRAKGGDFARA